MQPRILVKEQGQNKKRFISPTEIKNNQAIYGNPLGSSKIPSHIQPSVMTSDRIYSPQNRRSILELQRQQSQKQISIKMDSNQNNGQTERMRSIGQSTRPEPNIPSGKSSSKTKPSITKKDYMMSSLAKLNRHKPKGQDEESNGSQSRSKISSIHKNDKSKKPPTSNNNQQTNNIYNQKQQQVRRRARNTDNQSSQASSVQSEEGFGLEKSGRNTNQKYGKEYALYSESRNTRIDMDSRKSQEHLQTLNRYNLSSQPPTSPTIRPKINQTKSVHQSSSVSQQQISKQSYEPVMLKRLSKQQNQLSSQQNIILSPRQQSSSFSSNQQQQSHQQKLSFASSQQNRANDQPYRSQIEDGNNSSLVVHLKKAHEQKDELMQKKIQAEKQRNDLKQSLVSKDQQLTQLRTQLQHLQIQNLSLNSQLKSLKQYQTRTNTQLHDTTQKNQHIYRQLHEKYQHLTEQYRKIVGENDFLRKENQSFKIDHINYEKKVIFLENKAKQLEVILEQKQKDHMKQLKQTIEEWKSNVEKVQKQLRKHQAEGNSISNGSNLGQLKIKLIQCQTELSHKMSLLKSRDQQIKSLKKQASTKLQQLQQILLVKDKQIKDLNQQLSRQQKLSTDKYFQYQRQVKQLQVKLAKTEKDLTLKNIQLQQSLNKTFKSTQQQQLNLLYSTSPQHLTQQGQQARHSLQSMVSQQTSSINHYKKQLNKLISDNFIVKSQLQQQKAHNSNLKQELNILQMQYSALEKKQSQSRQTEIYMMKSQLQTAVRKQKELQQKLQSKTKQVKEKDQFIQSQLIRAANNNK